MSRVQSSSPKRRAQRRQVAAGSPIRLFSIALLAVVTIAGLALSGVWARPSVVTTDRDHAVTAPAATRQIVCLGHGPNAEVQTSAVLGSAGAQVRVKNAPTTLARRTTKQVVAPGIDSVIVRTPDASVVAGHVADEGPAVAGCVEARASWWFVGAGARAAHASTLVLVNPRPGVAIADVEVWGARGAIEADDLRGVPVESGAEVVLDLTRYLSARGDLAVHVSTTRGLVAAGMGDVHTSAIDAEPTATWLPATAPPGLTQRLVGLSPATTGRRTTVLTVGNPGALGAVVTVEATGSGGTFSPEGLAPIRVRAGAATTVDLSKVARADVSGFVITSNVAIAAAVRVTTGTSVTDIPAVVDSELPAALPIDPAVEATALVVATADTSGVVRAYAPDGTALATKKIALPSGVAVTVALPEGTAAVVVQSRGKVTASVLTSRDEVSASAPLTRPEPQRAAIAVRPR